MIRLLQKAALVLVSLGCLHAQTEETRNYPLGPIGGQFRVTAGKPYARVVALTAGAPGAAAGLQVNDYITGVFGKSLPVVGEYHYGVTQELGFAVDRAEGGDGILPLTVVRPGAGVLNLNVNLGTPGSFGPAYPLNSTKYDAVYENAVAYIHSEVMADNGNTGYFTGWMGLCLLGHPDWNSTTGPHPYRLSINKIRDYSVSKIVNGVYSPVESKLLDGTTDNPNFVEAEGYGNWYYGQRLMFLCEYYVKTGDTSVVAAIQRGMEMCSNAVEWWKQPPSNANGYSPDSSQIAGMSGHGGVGGDYIHLGWGGGINICSVHGFNGIAFARRAGMDMTARPRDGHYFGYATAPANAVPAGMENYDHTVDEKFLMQCNWFINKCGGFSSTPGNDNDGHVCYNNGQGWSAYDAAGRTPGAVLGMAMYLADGGTLSTADTDKFERMKGYITRQYMKQQESHGFCVGAQGFQALCMPYLSQRQRRFAMDNWRFFHALSRTPGNGFTYFRARSVNDNYLDETRCAAIDYALPRGIATGGLQLVPGYGTNCIYARFDNPDMRWPKVDYRSLSTNSPTVSLPVTLTDGLGNPLASGAYTAAWTKLSGPGSVTFSAPSSATTDATFSLPGKYMIQLVGADATHSVTEPVEVTVNTLTPPPGHVMGGANYQVYTGITGTTVASLTSAAKYPNAPDSESVVTSLRGTYDGTNYGSRLSGVIVAPSAGAYRFYISSDDNSQLKLNTAGLDGSAGTVACSVSDWTNADQWTKYPSQQSAVFNLAAGQFVAFEALQKNGGGGNHLSVGWSINGGAITVIDGTTLAYPVPAAQPMAITTQPAAATGTLGGTATFTVATTGPEPRLYQWRRNGVNIGAPTAEPTLTLSNLSGGTEASYDCVYTTPAGTLTSTAAALTLTDAGAIVNGGLWREVYLNTAAATPADLLAETKFPYFADTSEVITSAATPTSGDNYSQRWTGWVIPSVSGNYRFYLTSDDGSEIRLGSNELQSSATSILQYSSGYTGEKSWSSRSPSAYIPLLAGHRYYIEVRHVEGSGGDHCAVAWQRQGDAAPANGSGEIPSANLQYRVGGIYPETVLPNLAPAFTSTPIALGSTRAQTPYTGQTLATRALDPNSADTLTFTKLTGPAWLAVAPDGTLSGTPAVADEGGNTFTVRAADPYGLTADATLTLTVLPPNVPPVFTQNSYVLPDLVAHDGLTGTLATLASDGNPDDTLTFSKVSGPSWLTVAPDGTLSGTPSGSQTGTFTVTVRVTDAMGATADATLTLTVLPSIFHYDLNGATAGSGVTAAGGAWNSSAAWTLDPAGSSTTRAWAQGATAVFSAGNDATAAYTVTLDSAKTIDGLTVSTGNPTLGGGGLVPNLAATPFVIQSATVIGTPLSGAGGIVKSGTGQLTLGSAGTYTGGTVINGGTVKLGNSSALGGGSVTVNPGATLDVFSYGPSNSIILAGGTLDNSGAGGGSLYGSKFSLTANSTLASATNQWWTVNSGTYNLGGCTLTQTGRAWVASSGTTISNGTWQLNAQLDGYGARLTWSSTSALNVGTGGTYNVGGANTLNNVSGTAGTINLGSSTVTFQQPVDTTIASVIGGSGGGFVKTGPGTTTLSATNTYSGPSNLNSGSLLVTGSLASGSVVTTAAGTTLGGTGTINGATTVNGTLAPGVGGIGTLGFASTLSLAGSTEMQISKTGTSLARDRVQGVTTLTYGGTLNVTATGDALAAGDSFSLFGATAYSGSFATLNLPALGNPNLFWNTSRLSTTGTISVAAYSAPIVDATATATAITSTSVTSGGTIGGDGGYPVTARGVCWSTTANPTIADPHTTDGTGTGSFTSSATGLTPGLIYHLRAYATNSYGTGYGPDITVTTIGPDDYVWTNPSGGSWPVTTNWLLDSVGTGASKTIRFDTLDLTAAATVTLDGARTVGNLVFADLAPSHDWTLNTGTGGTLTLDVATGSPVVTVANRTATIGTVLAGTKGLVKNGPGTLALGNTGNTFGGNITVNGGLLTTPGTTGGSPLGSNVGGRTIAINSGASLKLQSNNVFGGGGKTAATMPAITITGGTFDSTRYNIIGTLTLDAATLTQTASDSGNYEGYQFLGGITVTGSAPSIITSTNGRANHLINGTTTFTVADVTASPAADLTVSNPLRNASGDYGSGTGSLKKDGTGTMILGAANTYTGTTTVNAGTLLVNGSTHASSAVSVASGAALGGGGTAAGTVTIATGATIAPGNNAVGTLNTGALALAGTYACQLDGTTADKIAVTGALNLSGSTLSLGGTATGTVVIATYTGTRTGTFSGVPTGYTVDYATTGQVRLTPPGGYTAWAATMNATGGPNGDTDSDGVPNLLEYATGTSPTAPNAQPGTLSGLTVTFPKNAAAVSNADLRFIIESSTDLVAWTPVVTQNPGDLEYTGTSVSYTLPSGTAHRFARLRVELVD